MVVNTSRSLHNIDVDIPTDLFFFFYFSLFFFLFLSLRFFFPPSRAYTINERALKYLFNEFSLLSSKPTQGCMGGRVSRRNKGNK